jgi:hypothetical protein
VNPLAELAGFAVVLALVFGAAALAGRQLDVHPGKPAARRGMDKMTAAGDGTAPRRRRRRRCAASRSR